LAVWGFHWGCLYTPVEGCLSTPARPHQGPAWLAVRTSRRTAGPGTACTVPGATGPVRGGSEFTDEGDFRHQPLTGLAANRPLYVLDQRPHIGGTRLTAVDDDVGVTAADLRTAHAQA